MIAIHPPMRPSNGGKRVARFTVGTSTAGWTAADCDYLCDGADDQVEINAAIQALPATGGEVVILDGTYNITAKIAVDKACVTLTGSGRSTVLKRMWNSSSKEGVIYATSDKSTIRNLVVDGNKSVYSSKYNLGIFSGGNYSTVTGNMCYNSGDCGVYFQGNYSAITENVCRDNMGPGISLYCTSTTITGNACRENGGMGIYLDNCTGCVVTGNVCCVNASGIFQRNSRSITIAENGCRANKSYGICLVTSHNCTVVGNHSIDNETDGIYLIDSDNSSVVGNVCIRGNGTASDYTSSQHTIHLVVSSFGTRNNLIAYNLIMGKNYTTEGGTGNTFVGNKYN